MISKDGNTLAQTLLDIVKIVQDLVMPRDEHLPHRKRLIHIITADGVPTNESASRKLWDHMQRNSGNIDYYQIHVKCASHQANLCVHVAICGAVTKSPLKMSGVCAAASRLFKYLVPSYYEQFRGSLHTWVRHVFCTEPRDDVAAAEQDAHVNGLVALYGANVCPPGLLQYFPQHMKYPHVVEGAADAG